MIRSTVAYLLAGSFALGMAMQRTSEPSADGIAASRALLEDELRFIDLTRSSLWLGEEVEIISLS